MFSWKFHIFKISKTVQRKCLVKFRQSFSLIVMTDVTFLFFRILFIQIYRIYRMLDYVKYFLNLGLKILKICFTEQLYVQRSLIIAAPQKIFHMV